MPKPVMYKVSIMAAACQNSDSAAEGSPIFRIFDNSLLSIVHFDLKDNESFAVGLVIAVTATIAPIHCAMTVAIAEPVMPRAGMPRLP